MKEKNVNNAFKIFDIWKTMGKVYYHKQWTYEVRFLGKDLSYRYKLGICMVFKAKFWQMSSK
jgi:hypothetical protein